VNTACTWHRFYFRFIRQRIAGQSCYQVARYQPPLQARALGAQEALQQSMKKKGRRLIFNDLVLRICHLSHPVHSNLLKQ